MTVGQKYPAIEDVVRGSRVSRESGWSHQSDWWAAPLSSVTENLQVREGSPTC